MERIKKIYSRANNWLIEMVATLGVAVIGTLMIIGFKMGVFKSNEVDMITLFIVASTLMITIVNTNKVREKENETIISCNWRLDIDGYTVKMILKHISGKGTGDAEVKVKVKENIEITYNVNIGVGQILTIPIGKKEDYTEDYIKVRVEYNTEHKLKKSTENFVLRLDSMEDVVVK